MVTFIHIPRTGGLALTEALRGTGVRADGHRFRLSDVDAAITIVRDPVAREASLRAHWPDGPEWWFAPESAWLDCDKPLLWVGHTETLAEDVERLREIIPGMGPLPAGYNASRLERPA